MSARVLNGNEIRDQILDEVQQGVLELSARGVQVGLAAVLVGDNPASEIYVRNKIRACERVGIFSERITPGKDISTADLLAIIEELNYRKDIHGILVQLPLPTQIDESKVLLAVSPTKDVDGFHPVNVGALVTRQIGFAPCTPAGLIKILKRSNIRIAGKHLPLTNHRPSDDVTRGRHLSSCFGSSRYGDTGFYQAGCCSSRCGH